jgi:hypothetical protein
MHLSRVGCTLAVLVDRAHVGSPWSCWMHLGCAGCTFGRAGCTLAVPDVPWLRRMHLGRAGCDRIGCTLVTLEPALDRQLPNRG